MMLDLIGPFIFGLAGSGHCLGMCGPLVLAYSLHLRPTASLGSAAIWPASANHHAAFHAGRLFTYGLLGVVPLRVRGLRVATGPFALKFFRRLFSSKRLAAKLSLGLAAGCLHCMFSLAMIVKAATTGPAIPGESLSHSPNPSILRESPLPPADSHLHGPFMIDF